MGGRLNKVKSMIGLGGPEYRTGLVLSGGGARGFAHAGALKALEEMGIKPDILAGVSAGSVAAVMYAAGISPEKMLELFLNARFSDFCELGIPKDGFFSLDRFRAFLRKNIPYANLEDLPIPVTVGATDLDNGKKLAFTSGRLDEVVAASCSIPIVFKPIKINGTRCVDGGVLHNLPAWTIRDRCKYLIAVIAFRSYELMAKTNTVADMELCDIVIRTDEIARYRAFNLKQIEKVFESGYRDTMNFLLYNGFRKPSQSQQSSTSTTDKK